MNKRIMRGLGGLLVAIVVMASTLPLSAFAEEAEHVPQEDVVSTAPAGEEEPTNEADTVAEAPAIEEPEQDTEEDDTEPDTTQGDADDALQSTGGQPTESAGDDPVPDVEDELEDTSTETPLTEEDTSKIDPITDEEEAAGGTPLETPKEDEPEPEVEPDASNGDTGNEDADEAGDGADVQESGLASPAGGWAFPMGGFLDTTHDIGFDQTGKKIYANGCAITIENGTITADDGTTLTFEGNASQPTFTLDNYTVFGGSQTGLASATSVTLVDTTLSAVYGGSENGDVQDGTNVSVGGNSTVGTVYGGSKSGNINGDISVSITGGTVGNVYGGSADGNITGDISVDAADSKVTNVIGGSVDGDITGNISVVVQDLTDSFDTVRGGSVNGSAVADNPNTTGTVTVTGTVYGDIYVEVQRTSGSVIWGASAVGEVHGDIQVYVNACPICDEGERSATPHACVNDGLLPETGGNDTRAYRYAHIYGGGGDTTSSTFKQIWRDYGNVYGNTKVVVSGSTQINDKGRLYGGGRQGTVRKNASGQGGNVTLIVKGNVYYYRSTYASNSAWSCAAGYYNPQRILVESDVNFIIGGNVSAQQLNGGGESGGVQGHINTELKENAYVEILEAASSGYWWRDYEGDSTNDDGATISVNGGYAKSILSTSTGYVHNFHLIVNAGQVDYIFGGGYYSGAQTHGVDIEINGGTITHVNAGGFGESMTTDVNITINQGVHIPWVFGGSASSGVTGTINALSAKVDNSVITLNGGSVGNLLGGGSATALANSAKIYLLDGTVNLLFGGGYINGLVDSTEIYLKGGSVNHLYLGGFINGGTATHVNSVLLDVDGGTIVDNQIYGNGWSQNDTVGDVTIQVHKLNSLDYIFYLDQDDLANAQARILPLDEVATFWAIEAEGVTHGYLYPYRLHREATVTFDKNGGDTDASPTSKLVAYPNTTVDSLPGEPTRADHTFLGWNTQANGKGSGFTASTEVARDITVYAVWRDERIFNVSYDGNGHTGGTLPATAGHTPGDSVTVAEGVTRTGYTFTGWKLDHNDKTYKAGASFTMPATNVTLTAQWTQNPVASSGPGSTPSTPASEPASSKPPASEGLASKPSTSALPASEPSASSEKPVSSDAPSDTSPAPTTSSGSASRAFSTTPASSAAPPPPPAASPAGSEAPSTAASSAPTTSAVSSSSSSSSTVSSSSDSSSVSSGEPEAGAFVVSEPLPPDDNSPGTPGGGAEGDTPAAGEGFSAEDLARIERQTGNVLRDLLNGEVPLGSLVQNGAWSLVSLILSVLSLLTSVTIGVSTLLRKRKQEDAEEQAYEATDEITTEATGDEPGDENPRRRKLAIAAALILGIFPGLLFIILDDMSLPLVLLNQWTLWVGVAFVLHMLVTLVQAFAKRKEKLDEEEEQALEPVE